MTARPGPLVRAATPAEFARIGELTAAAFIGGGTPADGPYAMQLRDVSGRADQCELLVAVDETRPDQTGPDQAAVDETGAIVGAVCFVRPGSPMAEVCRGDEAEFRMLAVAPAAQGRGIGEALVRACLDRARAAGYGAVAISTAERSASARHLYSRMGFVRIPDRDRELERGPKLLAFRIALS